MPDQELACVVLVGVQCESDSGGEVGCSGVVVSRWIDWMSDPFVQRSD